MRPSPRSTFNLWPGFVDALSSLLMVMLFALMIFIVSQYYLSEALTNRDQSLGQLKMNIEALKVELSGEQEKNVKLITLSKSLEDQLVSAQEEASKLPATAAQVESLQKDITDLNLQLHHLNEALGTSQATESRQKIEISDLNQKLNAALEDKVKELEQYRSEFFGKLKATLGERSDIQVVGDRFVFSSEVLFPSGSDQLSSEGQKKLASLAKTLGEISKKIPKDLKWILRIDGHTDAVPIKTAKFTSNWELSAARAISVVNFLVSKGVRPENLAATGFGEFQPLVENTTPDERAKNRRIEMRLDQR